MPYDRDRHHRRSIRLRDYDYTQSGAYFVTICTFRHDCLFGTVVDGEMWLNTVGTIVTNVWYKLPAHYSNVMLDAFVVMPNHIHAIIILTDILPSNKNDAGVRAGLNPALTTNLAPTTTPSRQHGLPEIVRGLKSLSTRQINIYRNTPGVPVWQRNYYEHIIRNETALNAIREYVYTNPGRWADDDNNPANF